MGTQDSITELLDHPEIIQPGSKEEILYHLVTSYQNQYFGWKQDDQGYYRELFLVKAHAKFLRRFYSLKKLRNKNADLYRIRPFPNS